MCGAGRDDDAGGQLRNYFRLTSRILHLLRKGWSLVPIYFPDSQCAAMCMALL